MNIDLVFDWEKVAKVKQLVSMKKLLSVSRSNSLGWLLF